MQTPTEPTTSPEPPALLATLLFGALAFGFVAFGSFAQLANVPLGLLWTEAFVFFGPCWLLVRSYTGRPAAWLRLERPTAKILALGVLVGLANYPLAAAMEGAVRNWVELRWPDFARGSDIAASTLGAVRGWQQLLLMLGLGLAAPLGEETAFRGLLQRSFTRRLGVARAIPLVGFLFGAIHLEPIGLLARMELGIVFGLLVLWTGSLWTSIAAHAANNLFAAALYTFSDSARDESLPTLVQLVELAALGMALTAPLLLFVRSLRRPTEESAWTPPETFAPVVQRWASAALISWVALVGGSIATGHFGLRSRGSSSPATPAPPSPH